MRRALALSLALTIPAAFLAACDGGHAPVASYLLERGANFDKAVMDRVDARGWFQRQWDKATSGIEPPISGAQPGVPTTLWS